LSNRPADQVPASASGAGVARAAVAGRGLVCQFGPVRALDDLSFEVAEGEVFGLLGPNGAGKTTVIRVVTTLLPPAAGIMEVFGLDTRRSTMRVRRLIGYVPQQLSIDASSPASRTSGCSPGSSTCPAGSAEGGWRAPWPRSAWSGWEGGWPRPTRVGWSAA
jgi:hypothetical protein